MEPSPRSYAPRGNASLRRSASSEHRRRASRIAVPTPCCRQAGQGHHRLCDQDASLMTHIRMCVIKPLLRSQHPRVAWRNKNRVAQTHAPLRPCSTLFAAFCGAMSGVLKGMMLALDRSGRSPGLRSPRLGRSEQARQAGQASSGHGERVERCWQAHRHVARAMGRLMPHLRRCGITLASCRHTAGQDAPDPAAFAEAT